MTRQEMLKQLGITNSDLKDLLQKFEKFHDSLNDPQREVIARSLPTTAAAAKRFGSNVTAKDLEDLFRLDPGGGVATMRAANPMPNIP
jgi:hypothetical protein